MDTDTAESLRSILPYTTIVGQEKLKLALELAYIAPRIGGVLISGKRGTAKSTTVRAFAKMMYGTLPVTIPINATEDRVVGGWQIYKLLKGTAEKQPGLLQEANGKLLYIDEVNLLDDHIVNIILDVTSTGKLVIQREGRNDQVDVQMILVGTMNPEEGGLRPQLQDRFGLTVKVETEASLEKRRAILETVLAFDHALYVGESAPFLQEAYKQDQRVKVCIEQAKELLYDVEIPEQVASTCVRLADKFQVDGHRSEYLLAMAARALAARDQQHVTTLDHLAKVAELVLIHRQANAGELNTMQWENEQVSKLEQSLIQV